MTTHVLKTDPELWDAVAEGKKTFELRFDDRGYAVGDMMELHRTNYTGDEMKEGKPLEYSGVVHRLRISHITRGYGLKDGWVGLSF